MPDGSPLRDGLSAEICALLACVRYDELPDAVIDRVKLFVLDTLGVIGGAANAPGIPVLTQRLGSWEGQGNCTSLLGGWQGSPPAAALANGAAAHALDYDDQHDPARTHSYCIVLPAVLAASQEAGGLDGKRFIAALAVGVELHTRLGLACYNSLGKGWHPTTALGTLAGGGAAAHALGLDAAAMLDALGHAYHQMGGSKQALADGVIAKRLGPGFAARNGVTAAFLAADGLSGVKRVFEGEAGLFALYERGEVDLPKLTEGLGARWEALNVSMKPFPCCRCNHSTIQLALELRGRGLKPEDIAAGTIAMGAVNRDVVGGRYEPDTATNPVVHAQFNAAFSFARALYDGRIGLDSYTPVAIAQPNVIALAQRLIVSDDPDVDASALAPARVDLTLRDGSVLALVRMQVKGSPEEPMSETEVRSKFDANMAFGLGASSGDTAPLLDAVLGLEGLDDATVLAGLFPRTRGN